jgi:hypothetical protein
MSLIVLGLLVVLILQRCGGPSVSVPKDTHDTVTVVYHHYHDSTIVSKPTIVNHIAAQPQDIPPEMAPDTSTERLLAQYNALLSLHYSKNIAQDSLKMASGDTVYGTVHITDTISQNIITGRKYTYHLDIPERLTIITNTIYPKPKFQVYVGGGVLGDLDELVSGVELGALLKNRKDQVFGVKVQKVINQPITYGLTSYWKIRLKK